MSFWDFWDQHWFLAFLALCFSYGIVKAIVLLPFKIANRWLRHRNIADRGWPPEHLDADGDWKPQPSSSDQ